jgi:hypothetical protein
MDHYGRDIARLTERIDTLEKWRSDTAEQFSEDVVIDFDGVPEQGTNLATITIFKEQNQTKEVK